ncbi:hypothetical protein [Spirosoma sp. KNUC1025]|uniref:hypothetical protein n=1 Tax=Spirosoma sp. KNUC1025 TaxID=2894082 RepID=UPI0038692FD6|nr:hypothetical protein LN737_33020 [Spirosoma sp. KNUC1025]
MTGTKNATQACKLFFLALAGLFMTGVALAQTTGTAITLGVKPFIPWGNYPPWEHP